MSPTARRSILAVLFLALSLLYALQLVSEWREASRRIGVFFDSTAEGVWIEEVEPDLPAARAGLRAGDRIVAAQGTPLADLEAYDLLAAGFQRGRAVALEIERAGSRLALRVVPGAPFPWLATAASLLAFIAFGVLAALAFWQGAGEPRGRLLFIYSVSVMVELALPLTLVDHPGWAEVAYPFLSLLVGAQIGLELHLASWIPRLQPWRRAWPQAVPTFYVLGVGLGCFYAASLVEYFQGSSVLPWTLDQAELLYWQVGMVFWALMLVLLLARPAFTWPEPVGRQQAGLVLVGALPWACLVLVRVTLEGVFGHSPVWVERMDPLVLFFYPLTIFVAIFRYRLFDLELVVKRGLVFTALTGASVLVVYLGILVVGTALSSWLPAPARSRWALASAALLLGLLFGPLRRGCQRLIEQRFFPERRALRAELVRLSGDLPALGNVSAMGRELSARLREIFRLEWAAIMLAEKPSGLLVEVESRAGESGTAELPILSAEEPGLDPLRHGRRPVTLRKLATESPGLAARLSRPGTELLVPLLHRERLIGLLLLGEREYGEPYRSEEVELLSLLSHQVASVLENAQLFESATRDNLTGLLRRGPTLERLERELRRAERFGRPLSIGMADIDHFKQVNDRHGHLVGDLMLKRVARAISRGLRTSDLVGRYGGEEFLLLLTETDLEGALTVAEKMRRAVEEVEIETESGIAGVTLSIGLAARGQLPARGPADVAALIDLADRALYDAKTAGRNRVACHRPKP